MRVEGITGTMTDSITKRLQNFPYSAHLYSDMPGSHVEEPTSPTSPGVLGFAAKLGLRMPNLAPEVEPEEGIPVQVNPRPPVVFTMEAPVEQPSNEPKKKKYAKEAWPGKKPTPSLLV